MYSLFETIAIINGVQTSEQKTYGNLLPYIGKISPNPRYFFCIFLIVQFEEF